MTYNQSFINLSISNVIRLVRSTSLRALIVGIALIGVTYISYWALKPENFPVSGVQIVNDQGLVSEQVLTDIVMPHLSNGFIRLEVSAIAEALHQEPWVKEVTVRRIWPDKLAIRIIEHHPNVYWNTNGVISEGGHYIEPELKNLKKELPHLYGPKGQEVAVWEKYKLLEQKLAPLKLHLKKVSLAERGAWQLELDNKTVVLLGKVEMMKRFERFIESFDTIVEKQGIVPHTVDCRYTSGMAVS